MVRGVRTVDQTGTTAWGGGGSARGYVDRRMLQSCGSLPSRQR
jgi:hypothetical protein